MDIMSKNKKNIIMLLFSMVILNGQVLMASNSLVEKIFQPENNNNNNNNLFVTSNCKSTRCFNKITLDHNMKIHKSIISGLNTLAENELDEERKKDIENDIANLNNNFNQIENTTRTIKDSRKKFKEKKKTTDDNIDKKDKTKKGDEKSFVQYQLISEFFKNLDVEREKLINSEKDYSNVAIKYNIDIPNENKLIELINFNLVEKKYKEELTKLGKKAEQDRTKSIGKITKNFNEKFEDFNLEQYIKLTNFAATVYSIKNNKFEELPSEIKEIFNNKNLTFSEKVEELYNKESRTVLKGSAEHLSGIYSFMEDDIKYYVVSSELEKLTVMEIFLYNTNSNEFVQKELEKNKNDLSLLKDLEITNLNKALLELKKFIIYKKNKNDINGVALKLINCFDEHNKINCENTDINQLIKNLENLEKQTKEKEIKKAYNEINQFLTHNQIIINLLKEEPIDFITNKYKNNIINIVGNISNYSVNKEKKTLFNTNLDITPINFIFDIDNIELKLSPLINLNYFNSATNDAALLNDINSINLGFIIGGKFVLKKIFIFDFSLKRQYSLNRIFFEDDDNKNLYYSNLDQVISARFITNTSIINNNLLKIITKIGLHHVVLNDKTNNILLMANDNNESALLISGECSLLSKLNEIYSVNFGIIGNFVVNYFSNNKKLNNYFEFFVSNKFSDFFELEASIIVFGKNKHDINKVNDLKINSTIRITF